MPLGLDGQNRGFRLRLSKKSPPPVRLDPRLECHRRLGRAHGTSVNAWRCPHRSASKRTLFGPIAESKCDEFTADKAGMPVRERYVISPGSEIRPPALLAAVPAPRAATPPHRRAG